MNARLLVVDDEAQVQELLADFFQAKGYQTTTAANAAEASRCLERETFDLVILDIFLPDMQGLEWLESIRPDYPRLPVIVLTGMGFDEQLLQQARRCGACGYVSKSLPLSQLLMEVHRVLKPT